MAIKKGKLKIDQWDISLELELSIDTDKYTEKLAHKINDFWSGAAYRLEESDGDIIKTALKLYGAAIFQEAAFNNFLDNDWVTDKFDWDKGNGVEGFESFSNAGITLFSVENLQIESDIIEVEME